MGSLRHLVATTLTLVALTTACASGADDEAGAPATTVPTATAPTTTPTAGPTTSTTATVNGEFAVDWTGDSETPLPNGWTIRPCDGGRPHVCVHDGATFLGDIELLGPYPLSPNDDATEPGAVAMRWAREMIDRFREDRAKGCADFTFAPLDAKEVVVGDRPGARAGFTLADADGRIVERVVNHYSAVDEGIMIINTDAYAIEGGCLAPSETDLSFTPERLAALDRGLLDRIAADSPVRAD